MIILLGCSVGGSGKSTIAQNLAAAFTHKDKSVVLVDADLRKVTTRWGNKRKRNPKLKRIDVRQHHGNIASDVALLKQQYDVVIIDCGGFESRELFSAIAVCDIMLIPFRVRRRDLESLEDMEEIALKAKMHNLSMLMFSVLSQCPTLPTQYPRIWDAEKACKSFGLPALKSKTFTRNAYDDSDEFGMSVIEYTDRKACNEIINMANEIEDIFKKMINGDAIL